jgi:hypothetical protein
MRRWTVLVLPLVFASAAACGSNEANVGPQEHPSTHASATDLTVTVTAKPGAKARAWSLRCDPAGGDHPAAAKACAALAKAKSPFQATPKNRMCTQIFGGPQKAHISGTWHGTKINATYSRQNGCEIDRWNAIKTVLNQKA